MHLKPEFELYPYQKKVVEWMAKKETNVVNGTSCGILCLYMGLGKTYISLHHIVAHKSSDQFPTLVVVSKTLMYEWMRNGIEKFLNDCKVLYYHKDFTDHLKAMSTKDLLGYDIVITTYDVCLGVSKEYDYHELVKIRSVEPGIHCDKVIGYKIRPEFTMSDTPIFGRKALYETTWTRIICDESQRFSNPKSKTYTAMMALPGVYRWCLTGTPIRNCELDIWTQLSFCGFKQSQKMSYYIWRQFNCKQHLYVLDYEKAGVTMPPLVHKNYEVKMTPNQKKAYMTVQEHLKNVIMKYFSKTVSYIYVLAIFTRLRQICVAPHLIVQKNDDIIDEIGKNKVLVRWMLDAEGQSGILAPKITKIIEIAAATKKEKIIVFSAFSSALELCTISSRRVGINCVLMTGDTTMRERIGILDEFQNNLDVKIMFVHYKVGSEGLNLTQATHIIPLEPWWNHATHNQGISRAWRIGQRNTVTVHWLMVEKTMESAILRMCGSKLDISDFYLGKTNERPPGRIRLSAWRIQSLTQIRR